MQTRFSTVPTSFEIRETQIHANGGSGGEFQQENRRAVIPSLSRDLGLSMSAGRRAGPRCLDCARHDRIEREGKRAFIVFSCVFPVFLLGLGIGWLLGRGGLGQPALPEGKGKTNFEFRMLKFE